MVSKLPSSRNPPSCPAMSKSLSNTLPDRINTATRKQHTHLNRLLMERLPLALPPYTDSPLLLGKGIIPFAKIFMLFEIEWDLLTRHFNNKSSQYSGHGYELREWLSTLRPLGLARSNRLREDLHHLRMIAGRSVYETVPLGDQWTQEMRVLVRKKPHVLVAFAWVFYMAVFSGGRWIRQQLANGGAEFWLGKKSTLHPHDNLDVPGFSFLSFDGDQDGEDVKAMFKLQLADAEGILSEDEKQEVIQVSQQLFDRCVILVGELDRAIYWQKLQTWLPLILLASVPALAILAVFVNGSGFLSRS